MTNLEVIRAFIDKKSGNSLNLHSDGDRLFSYFTCIAEWNNKSESLLNVTKYSVTTSRHLTYLIRYIPVYINVIELANILKGTKSLFEFITKLK